MTGKKGQAVAHAYSMAFEKLVQGPDDIVGLLAYANYKMAIRETYQDGQTVDISARTLTTTSVETYRSAAEQQITEVVDDGIKAAAPDIRETALNANLEKNHAEVGELVRDARDEVKSHMTSRTGFGTAFLTNLAAWATTIVIAALIIFLASRPSVERTISETIDGSTDAAAIEQAADEATPQTPQQITEQ